MSNWLQDSVEAMNQELKKTERAKHKRLADERLQTRKKFSSKLKDQDVWMITAEESHLIRETSGYGMQWTGNTMATAIRDFVNDDADTSHYRRLDFSAADIEHYISVSAYWNLSETLVNNVRVVFAENESIKCVICKFKGKMVITTRSSFLRIIENIRAEIEAGTYISDPLPSSRNRGVRGRRGQYRPPAQDHEMDDFMNHLDDFLL